MLNIGPTRADPLGIEKIELSSGLVLRDVVRSVLYVSSMRVILYFTHMLALCSRGGVAGQDAVVQRMLQSGVVQPPDDSE